MQSNAQQVFTLFMKAIFPGSDTRPTQVSDMDPWPVRWDRMSKKRETADLRHYRAHYDVIVMHSIGTIDIKWYIGIFQTWQRYDYRM